MKKNILLMGGTVVLLFALFFAVTGWDELWSNGTPWLFGFIVLVSSIIIGCISLFLGMKETSPSTTL